ncbi:hypothetical protein EDD30_0264 [Couchioplanes caeruleus]|uniref:CBM-cenC domain-containing protein n=3 Tax=Couchioplanes caeruleus TaxID=56438 RepID=A0A1K0FI60_9ACTN|nr:hypothetical protein BG844_20205 [Couchioplanes caeruleus subsp. caeruleus]ROP27579.1 hypothetical protein EDD30_0264 [Couchioplanes caeruleus]
MRMALRVLPAVLLTAAAPVLPLGTSAALAATDLPDAPYSLDATVSPAPLTGCATDVRCKLVFAPTGADDWSKLQGELTAAGSRAQAPVLDANGTVVTPAVPATVLLRAGTYSVTKPLKVPVNVNLRGAGIKTTAIKIDDAAPWINFNYSFLIKPTVDPDSEKDLAPGSVNTVSDLTLNGRCIKGKGAYTDGASQEPTIWTDAQSKTGCESDFATENNAGGGIKAGNRWTVQQVRFTNFNYFKLWVSKTRDVHIIDNRWDNWGGAGSGDEDNIGGGGENTGTVIEHNQWDQTIRGNSFDFTHAKNVTFNWNKVVANRYYAKLRDVEGYGSVYFESVVGGTVIGNKLKGANIVLKSNANYEHTGENFHVTNSRDFVVRWNEIRDTYNTGISLVYDDYPQDSLNPHKRYPGGNNTITENGIMNTAKSAILITGVKNSDKDAPDTITGNSIFNVGMDGTTEYVGYDPVGIAIGIGDGDKVYGNSIRDNQAQHTTWYGLQIGSSSNNDISVTNIHLTDAYGNGNTTPFQHEIIGGLIKYGALAALPPTNLTSSVTTTFVAGAAGWSNGVVTWSESVPQNPALGYRPIAGYRVYRGASLAADLPVGSSVVPGNLLTAEQADFESGVTGYTVYGGTAAAKTGDAAIGNGSLLVTTGATNRTVTLNGQAVPVTAGTTYTSVASFKAVTSGGRVVRAGMSWRDANNKSLGQPATQNKFTIASTGNWITSSHTEKAPAGAVTALPFLVIDNSIAGEQHLIDRVGLVAGTNTEGWTDSGRTYRYHVVAYRAGDLQNSTPATVIG